MKVAVAAVAVCAVLAAAGRDELRGRIAAVDSAAETIEVSGVKILARGAVIEDEQDRRIPLADLKAGDGIEVDGAFNAAGELAATKIERDSSPAARSRGPSRPRTRRRGRSPSAGSRSACPKGPGSRTGAMRRSRSRSSRRARASSARGTGAPRGSSPRRRSSWSEMRVVSAPDRRARQDRPLRQRRRLRRRAAQGALTRRADNGQWCLPGGHVDPGETVAESCRREVEEETGCACGWGGSSASTAARPRGRLRRREAPPDRRAQLRGRGRGGNWPRAARRPRAASSRGMRSRGWT